MTEFILNLNEQTEEVNRYWELCVGSCHAATALREDYRRQLSECSKELGFKYVRFHGIFNDDMSVLTKSYLSGEYMLSFTNIDNIFDFLLSINMKPFIELGFMPECIKSGNETIFHYKGNVTPPSDEKRWEWLIENFANHLIDRYGRAEVRSWFFEVWNEPNLGGENGFAGGRFWTGSMQDYFRLYEITATTIKKVDSYLRVGGPATSNNAHIPDMIDFCKKNNVALDFVSTHHYPTDVVLGYGVEDSKNFMKEYNDAASKCDKNAMQKFLKNYLTFQESIWEKVDRGVLTDMAKRAKKEAGDLPLYYTEWNSLAGIHSDGAFGASFIAKTVMDNMGIVDGYAYWTFSDIFEERSMPSAAFYGGFGLMTLQGIKKATYRAFELLHILEGRRYKKIFTNGTVDCYAFTSEQSGIVQILAVNHNSLMHEIKPQEIKFTFDGFEGAFRKNADIMIIDNNNANAVEEWKKMGMPEYITEEQRLLLNAKSCFSKQCIAVKNVSGGCEIVFKLEEQATALITLYKE